MILLVISLLFFTAFGQLQKLAISKKCDLWLVGLINYIFASALAGLYGLTVDTISFSPRIVWTGVLGGLSFAGGLLVTFWGIKAAGLSLSISVARLSVLVPTLLSIFIWKEVPTAAQIAGIGIILVALVLLSLSRGEAANGSRWSLALVLAIFIMSGSSQTIFKLVNELGLYQQKMTYLMILFFVAALSYGSIYLFRPKSFKKLDLTLGLILGGCNILGSWSSLAALEEIQGVIFFPVSSSASLALSALLATLIWKEKVDRRGIAGIALTIGALFLISF